MCSVNFNFTHINYLLDRILVKSRTLLHTDRDINRVSRCDIYAGFIRALSFDTSRGSIARGKKRGKVRGSKTALTKHRLRDDPE